MTALRVKMAAQAKALLALWLTFLAQVYAVIGDTGNLDALRDIPLGKWVGIAIWTANAYGLVYAIPNIKAAVSAPPASAGSPLGFSPTKGV